MPITRDRNIEWQSHNSVRAYPLAQDATARDVTGDFRLPADLLTGLSLSVGAASNVTPAAFSLLQLGVYATGISLVIGYHNGTNLVRVASALIPRDGHTKFAAYRLGGVGDFFDAVGWVTIGQFDNLDAQPAGLWTFDLAGGRLEPDTIRPQIRGLSSLRIQNGTELSDPIVGDVVLKAGRNLRLTLVTAEGEDPEIVIDAIEGEGLNEDCFCAGDVETSPPIRTINKIRPRPDGEFTLLGDDCLEWQAIPNGLQAKDVCSEPCCGCAELATVTAAMEQFGRQATTLENFLVGLEARVTQMDMVVLGSRLGDRGCNTCE